MFDNKEAMVMVCGSDKRRRAKKGEYLKREGTRLPIS